MVKLDKIDHKLLHALSENSRRSISKIAKSLKISKNTLLYRIKKLEKNKTILFYQTLVDNSLTGVFCGQIMIKFLQFDEVFISDFIKFVNSFNKMGWLSKSYGKYDIIIGMYFRRLTDFSELNFLIHEKISAQTKLIDLCFINKIYPCAPNVILNGDFIAPVETNFNLASSVLDKKDMFLLKTIVKDPKKSVVSLAEACGCTTKTIMQRKKLLEKSKVILRYSVVLNYANFGYSLYHVFWYFSNFKLNSFAKLKEYISHMPETLLMAETFYSALLESRFIVKNELELHQLLQKIMKKFPDLIKSYDSVLITEVKSIR